MDYRTPCTLAEKIAALRAAKKPFALETFLAIYNKAEYECDIDYMKGAEALYLWLTNDRELELTHSVTPLDLSRPVPNLLGSYYLLELAKIMSNYKETWNVNSLSMWKRILYYTTLKVYSNEYNPR